MAGIRQGIRFRARNRKARFVRRYYIIQKVRTQNKKQTTRYSYGKKIVAKRKKYSYKRG